MEHDGSRVAADLSHEGCPLIRKYGEPGRQGALVRAGIYRKLAGAHSRWLEEAARNTALGKWGPTGSQLTGRWCRLTEGGQPAASLRLIATCCRGQLTSHISHRSQSSLREVSHVYRNLGTTSRRGARAPGRERKENRGVVVQQAADMRP